MTDLLRAGRPWGVGLMVLGSSAACASASSGAPEPVTGTTAGATSALHLDFEELTAEYDAVVPSVRNAGTAEVRIAVVTAGGGRVRLAPTEHGAGIRFPGYAESRSAGAAAAVVAWDLTGDLSPGTRTIGWGAVVKLDTVSDGAVEPTGATGSATDPTASTDNGDNVLQRGTYADPSQLKLQLDHGVPSCRVQGVDGDLVARATEPVERDRWYQVDCTREGETLRLRVQPLEGGPPAPRVSTVRGRLGSVEFPTSVPWSVGAKVSNDGLIATSATDQFNGVVDEVHVSIDSSIGGWLG